MILCDGSTVEDPRLGRIPQFDPRSLSYGIMDATPDGIDLRTREIISKVRIKAKGPHLDQGREGSCVGNGFTNVMRYEPNIGDLSKYDEHFAVTEIYRPAQKEDEFPGEEPEMSGTSLIAALKVAKRKGFIKEFRWAFNLEQMCIGIGYYGAAMIGVNWYQGMERPDKDGFIYPTGRVMGGHCVAVVGCNKDTKLFRIVNSWGNGWGDNGECYISCDDMDKLLHERGECAFVLKS